MNDDVLTHEERTTVEELREMAQHGFYSVAAGFDAKCVAVIDRLVAEVGRLRRPGTVFCQECERRAVEGYHRFGAHKP